MLSYTCCRFFERGGRGVGGGMGWGYVKKGRLDCEVGPSIIWLIGFA